MFRNKVWSLETLIYLRQVKLTGRATKILMKMPTMRSRPVILRVLPR